MSPAIQRLVGGSGGGLGGACSRCLKMRLSLADLKSSIPGASAAKSDSKSKGIHSHKTLLNVSKCAEGVTCEEPLGTR